MQPVGCRVRQVGSKQELFARRLASFQMRASGSNAESPRAAWLGPQPLPQLEQGTYVMVLPVSTITANFLAGVPRYRVA